MNASKAKGTRAETAVVNYLREQGFVSAHRKVLSGNKDKGDVQITPWCIAEVKAHATVTDGLIEQWLIETETEQGNSGALEAVLIVARHRKPINRAWTVTRNEHGHIQLGYLEDWTEAHRAGQ